jgi:hypothetical protein
MNTLKILRYELPTVGEICEIKMPIGSEILDAVWQQTRGTFSIYAQVNANQKKQTEKRFIVLGTGEEITGLRHIRSIVFPDGFHVFHVFEA